MNHTAEYIKISDVEIKITIYVYIFVVKLQNKV